MFDRSTAERVCRFVQLLPHTKGKWASRRERIKLEPWQQFFLCVAFGWLHKDTGKRRFREVYLEVPRKNGKSIIAAGVGLYCLVADREFGSEVYSGATSEKQAWEVFRPARLMVKRTPELAEHYGLEVNAATLTRLSDASRFEPLIGNPGDGASPHCVVVDEYHEHVNDDLYNTMITGMGARDQPLMFIITTAGSNVGGPCYDKRGQVIRVLNGAIQNDELFGLIYTLDDDDEWTDECNLRKANPNYDVSVSKDYLRSRLLDAMQSARRQAVFQTKHLNRWVGARNAWMDLQAWNRAPARKTLEELATRHCFGALDLASKVDVAALLLVFPPIEADPHWHVHGRYYLPEKQAEDSHVNGSHYDAWAKQGLMTLTDGWVIDFDRIMEDMIDLGSRVQVAEWVYDPWQATHLANTMEKEGVTMVEMAHTVKNLSEPMKEVESLVLQRKLAHGGCPVLTWMASNVVAKLDRKDNIYPTKEQNENKIDGVVALIMGVGRAIRYDEEESVYETRGIMTL